MAPRWVLLYDADCGICSFFARGVKRLDLAGHVAPVPLSSPLADPWFAGVSDEVRFGTFHVVRPLGDRASGGRALIAVVEALPLGSGVARFLSRMPVAVDAAQRFYDLVVRYRGFLAGLPKESGRTSALSGPF